MLGHLRSRTMPARSSKERSRARPTNQASASRREARIPIQWTNANPIATLETRNAPFVRQLGKRSPAAEFGLCGQYDYIAQRTNIEHEVHHLAAKLRIFRFEPIKQSFIPWASPVVLAS